MPRVCLQFVIVVFPDHTHLVFSIFTHKIPHVRNKITMISYLLNTAENKRQHSEMQLSLDSLLLNLLIFGKYNY